MNLQLGGKLALVSGSTAGIGYAIARTLAEEGAAVIVNGRTQEAVDAAVARIRAETHGTVHGHAADLSNAEAAQDTVQRFPVTWHARAARVSSRSRPSSSTACAPRR